MVDIQSFRSAKFSQMCWNILNDTCYLPIVINISPQMLSTAIIYFVAKFHMFDIKKQNDGKDWFQVSALHEATV